MAVMSGIECTQPPLFCPKCGMRIPDNRDIEGAINAKGQTEYKRSNSKLGCENCLKKMQRPVTAKKKQPQVEQMGFDTGTIRVT